MRSDLMKQGLEKYPHRSLMKAMGLTDREIDQPIIGVANSYNEFIPGHIHLDKITQAAKAGVRSNGGTPLEFGVIGVCDGLAMHHAGMKYSLPSRELIADSIKIMALVAKQILPRQIATLAAFKNAMAVDMALGCSTNTVLHVPAIAREAGIELSLDLFNEISVKTPHLCSMSPGGAHHMQDLDAAGGVPAVMAVLMEAGLVDGSPLTATGATVADNLATVRVLDPSVIL